MTRTQYSGLPVALMITLVLAGCGASTTAPAPVPVPLQIAVKPDVVVTLDGKQHSCVVALYSEPQGNAIACDEVVPFMKDELRLKPGSVYDLHAISEADKAQLARVSANLKAAGYQFIGGHQEL